MSYFSPLSKTLMVLLLLPLCAFAKDKGTPPATTAIQNDTELSFLENNGRIRDLKNARRNDIDFSMTSDNINVFVGNGKIQYQWFRPLLPEATEEQKENLTPDAQYNLQQKVMNSKVATYRLDVTLVGANKNAQLVKGQKASYYEKYYLPDREDEVVAYTYNTITYKNVYPNIDWVLYAKDNHLKYDFVVHPGGNVKDIKVKYNGAEKMSLKDGALVVNTAQGTITEQAPFSYMADTKEEVTSSFNLDGNILSFNVEAKEGTLVIDPFLDWATYHGGNHYDWGSSVTTDYMGNIYLAGWTYSTNNIATSGAYQDTLTPNIYNQTYYYYNGYVAKFDKDGVKKWATYYPGFFNAATCDGFGNLYLTGWTDSIKAIATTGAHQDTFGGRDGTYYWYNGDAFVVKFNTNGTRIWGTFYGGESWDGANAVTYDPAGYIYIGGSTSSKKNIATKNSHLDTLPPRTAYYYYYYSAGFIAKFNTNGVRQWGTYYNGMVTSISVDKTGNFAVVGTTFDTTGVATTGAHQTLHAGLATANNPNNGDGFIAQFNSNGVRQWGTYYGGQSWDWLSGVDHDDDGYVYITGTTVNDVWLATSNGHQTSLSGYYDAHLAKFSPGGVRIWATYYGGVNYENASSVKISPYGKVYINGNTASPAAIATTDGHQKTLGGVYDTYIVEFDTSGKRLWATYFGGSDYEYNWGWGWGGGWGSSGSHSMDASVAGKLYTVGATRSTTGIATTGAHQTTFGGNYYDGFLASWIVDTIPYVKHPFTDTLLCAGDTIRVPYGVTYPFQSGNTFMMYLSDANGSFGNPTLIGQKSATDADTIVCVIPNNVTTGSKYRIRITATNPYRVSADNQIDMKIYAPPTPLVAGSNSPLCEGTAINLTATHPSASGITYSWTGPNSFTSTQKNPVKGNGSLADTGEYIVTATIAGLCSVRDTTKVVVNIIPEVPIANSNSVVCPGTVLNLYASNSTPGVSYSWTGPNSFTSTVQNPAINNATYSMAGTYYVTSTLNGCTSAKDSAIVVVAITTPTPVASSNSPICEGQALELTSSNINNATYNWTGPNNYTASTTSVTATLPNANKNAIGTYYVTATVNGCVSLKDSVTITVNKAPEVNIYPSPGDSICVGGSVTFVSIGSNGGTNPQLQWVKNNVPIPGANSPTYMTSNVVSGDFFYCTLTSTTTCSSPATDTSIPITITVRPIVAPEVTITVDPDSTVKEGELITFTATPKYGGRMPKFQWKRNGQNVQGATGSVWGTYELSDGDVISVDMLSNDPCTNPKDAYSNKITVNVLLSVDDLGRVYSLNLYPNPNTGTFTLKGKTATTKEIRIDVINSVGQLVYSGTAMPANGELNKVISLDNTAVGIYLLRISNEDYSRTMRFTVTK